MKRTTIAVTLTLPGEGRPTVGEAQDLFDALDEAARQMGADVDIKPARRLLVCDGCHVAEALPAVGWSVGEGRDLCPGCAGD